jgi:hypothetical protein
VSLERILLWVCALLGLLAFLGAHLHILHT